MSYMVCHMSLFLRAGHLGHLKNSSNLPSPGPQEEWDVPQRDTPAVGSLAQGGPSALLQARCSLCPLCPSTLPPGFCLVFPFQGQGQSTCWCTRSRGRQLVTKAPKPPEETTSTILPLRPVPFCQWAHTLRFPFAEAALGFLPRGRHAYDKF